MAEVTRVEGDESLREEKLIVNGNHRSVRKPKKKHPLNKYNMNESNSMQFFFEESSKLTIALSKRLNAKKCDYSTNIIVTGVMGSGKFFLIF